MLDIDVADSTWIIWTSLLGTACLSASIIVCVCGCKTSVPKDELTGVEGHVKKRNPEEYSQEVNANNIPSNSVETVSQLNNEKKPISTANRSLPDLPIDKHNSDNRDVSWEPNGDTNSDLYATVGIQDEKRRRKESAEIDSRSPSTTYAHIKGEHPYDKLKNVEHPYAQVRHNRESSENVPSTSHHRPTSGENRLSRIRISSNRDSVEPEVPHRETVMDIHAANAISGQISANDELPYMTPPTYFSGDSQDSGKGYTSISVREPLATIRAESESVKELHRQKEIIDSHYATVSDDSDEMYAAIEDPAQVYTSESETYAQIQPNRMNDVNDASAPQPPSVDSLKHMTVTSHSRQPSSSSGSSSGVVNSPKPEKRPANSPLPPPPAKVSTEDLYGSSEKLKLPVRNVEDMYAKVNKKKNREVEQHNAERNSTESGMSESSDSVSYKLQINQYTDTSRSSTSYHSKTTTDSSTSPSARKELTDSVSSSDEGSCSSSLIAGYERLGFEDSTYERAPSDSDPNYEQLRPQEHEYASIARKVRTDDGYARVERSESDATDGYARVRDLDRLPCDPLREDDTYATVNKGEDPGYESVMSKDCDGVDPNGYESVNFKKPNTVQSNVQTEPTYESLGNEFDDPNYESVNYTTSTTSSLIDPPYQLLREYGSGSTSQ